MLGIGLGVLAVQQRSPFTPIDMGGDIPDGATAHFSFAQGVYWTEADGNLTQADVVSGSAVIVNGVGYTGGGDDVQLIGSALAAMSPTMTAVARGRIILPGFGTDTSSGVSMFLFDFSDADYNAQGLFLINFAFDTESITLRPKVQAYDPDSDGELIGVTSFTINADAEARFDTAYTLTPTALSVSMLGGATETFPIDVTLPSTPEISELTYQSILDTFAVQLALESITIYPAQAGAALPALSTPL